MSRSSSCRWPVGRRNGAAALVALLASTALPFGPGAASAQSASSVNVAPRASADRLPGIAAQRQALFAQMLADPSDLDAAFRYAA
ncbi:hypothetical protein, partial [Aureimonas pseudogalii]|uniref:hypothetical protein n=1 Tax=Aureimonas pseudogalii TaxID=1744844 RepID=UPI0035EB35C7